MPGEDIQGFMESLGLTQYEAAAYSAPPRLGSVPAVESIEY